jgi:hypothetical protein
MGRHIHMSDVPTVLIFSDVREGKHQPRDLERLVDPQTLYSKAATIMQCHPVTKVRMKKTLEAIGKKESVEVPANFCEEMHLQSGGDLRHAIMSLQFRGRQTTTGANKSERDAKLSMFHTLGKLLYAKRQKVDEPPRERTARAPLAFDPERVMEQSGMELFGAIAFLGYHSPDFFTDVSELSEAFDHYSDSAMLLDQSNEVSQRSLEPLIVLFITVSMYLTKCLFVVARYNAMLHFLVGMLLLLPGVLWRMPTSIQRHIPLDLYLHQRYLKSCATDKQTKRPCYSSVNGSRWDQTECRSTLISVDLRRL